MPQVIVNKAKWREETEGLELFRKLAKQVLSQLSYTPTAGYSNHFPLLTLHPQPLVHQKSWSTLEQVMQIQFQLSQLLRAAGTSSP